MTAIELRETVVSPEGVDLHFGTAGASDRIVALIVDVLLMLLILLGITLATGFTLGAGVAMLCAFFIRHGYFIWFEARSNGRTPGKRLFHLRVIRADGGPLTTEILLARNLTREVEMFLPLVVILSPAALFPEHDGWLRLVASLWILLLLFFPLTNPRRLRIGDLLAGTRVVISPPAPLLRDLADRGKRAKAASIDLEFTFSEGQLDIYGERELDVLEDVLRKQRTEGAEQAFDAVAKSICKRIDYDNARIGGRNVDFLRAFYKAQRKHLEQRLLFGKRRLRKKARSTPPPLPPNH